MVDPGTVICNQLQPLACLADDTAVDLIGDAGHKNIAALDRVDQFIARHAHVGVAKLDVEQFFHPRFHHLGQATGHDHVKALCGHGHPPGEFRVRCFQIGRVAGKVPG